MTSDHDFRSLQVVQMPETIGYGWLAQRFGVTSVAPITVNTSSGRQARRTEDEDGYVVQVLRHGRTELNSVRWHLSQALKHEGVHLELLARVFRKLDPQELEGWLREEPTSGLARRAGFLYEWLTGGAIHGHDAASGNYVDALDSQQYLVSQHPVMNRRWRVMDNMPGSPQFCPMVRMTTAVRLATSLNPAAETGKLMSDFGEDAIMRSANWLSIKESKASFTIESEGGRDERIRRFAAAMMQHCGRMEDPLAPQALAMLQKAILCDRNTTTSLGLRKSPVFVGRTIRYEPVVDYLAPHHEHVPGMLEGLRVVAQRTAGASPVLRAALLSFAFVYIHPLSDGNGRISRFLINDTLRRDGAIPAPLILPVSSVIQAGMRRYDQVLESVSVPLMQQSIGDISFTPREQATAYADGVKSNLVFDHWEDLAPAWRYMDLSRHVRYMSETLRMTLCKEMRTEAEFLRNFDRARTAVRDVVDGPDQDLDRIVNSIHKNQGVSAKLRKEFGQVLTDADVPQLVKAVLDAFGGAGSDQALAPSSHPEPGQDEPRERHSPRTG